MLIIFTHVIICCLLYLHWASDYRRAFGRAKKGETLAGSENVLSRGTSTVCAMQGLNCTHINKILIFSFPPSRRLQKRSHKERSRSVGSYRVGQKKRKAIKPYSLTQLYIITTRKRCQQKLLHRQVPKQVQ